MWLYRYQYQFEGSYVGRNTNLDKFMKDLKFIGCKAAIKSFCTKYL